ncbi:hypothetical protein [Streptomyces sp. N35]|uniref:hypothetical protein n=1 Tax=Streptomyces sp. N35 TaxID=2795730 RepID=UPI0018F7AF9E|nr:hypothetical protein [Streptomyces sp. N35]
MTSSNDEKEDDPFERFKENQRQTDEDALKGIAENPEAFAMLLSEYQASAVHMLRNLETLQVYVRVHCRNQRVEGDKWKQALWRSVPTEMALRRLVSALKGVTRGLENSARKRYEHAEGIKSLKKERALARARMNQPQLKAVPGQQGSAVRGDEQHVPRSVYDLQGRDSA